MSASHRIAFDAGRVCQVLTPGTLTDEELLGTPAAVYTLSVCEDEGSGTIGAAVLHTPWRAAPCVACATRCC